MLKDKEIFFSISLLSIYIFFKEKYKDNIMDDSKKNIELENIGKLLSKLSKYQYLPNKHIIVEDAYNEFLNCKVNLKIDENKMFEIVSKNIETLSEDEKKYVLNSIIFIANIDKKITNEEKELITQVNYLLGFRMDFSKIMEDFNKSEFATPISTVKIVLFFMIIVMILAVGLFYFYKNQDNKINIFKNERVVFNEMTFNRYVIYKNSFVENKFFLKQAIFYFDGVAEIGFDPKNINYNSITKEVTLLYKNNPFIVNTSFNNIFLVDKIDPEPISVDEAKLVAGGLAMVAGYAGAVAGGKAGGTVGNLVGTAMPNLKLIAPVIGTGIGSVVGGAATGLGAYYITKNILGGMQLSSDITKEEEEKVKVDSKKLINEVFNNDEMLLDLYINSFENFIKNKYASVGIEVTNIKYKEVK